MSSVATMHLSYRQIQWLSVWLSVGDGSCDERVVEAGDWHVQLVQNLAS